MIDLFMPFRSFLKFENVCTDNNIFRMHYKLTVIVLLVFTLLVTSKQFFGEPIHCMGDNKDIDKDAINSYCWIYGTYTLKSKLVGVEGKNMAYLGVGPSNIIDEPIKHTYYQWVCFVLLGQAAMFYAPRYLWKMWEGGRLKALASDLASPIVTKDWTEYRRGELISYLSYTNLYTHNMYALRYAFCEILNLLNVVGQIFLLDLFLGGAFRNYGAAVAAFTHIPKVPSNFKDFSSINPMDQFFPKLTKCWFRSYGPSGTLQLKDRLCVLPLNIVNEKIFVILWFWLIFLTLLSAAAVLFRILVFTLPALRTSMIMGQLRYVKRRVVAKIVKNFGFGDWFILYLLGKNMNPIIYKDLILELSKEVGNKPVTV
ncbi:innexin inx2-like [Vanessa tameamea]|uniref:Innexin n=1 Tax=Vanessa tameamea TaxID=334116 RepID=A0A8B8IPG2_VANTA|nr:innexin inx2-like [Vanessa tameamea]XP_047529799.1 innexin inx2-like [Vanessa atalanta]